MNAHPHLRRAMVIALGTALALACGIAPAAPETVPANQARVLTLELPMTDAQDFLFEGCTARVEALLRDVDDRTYAAVTIEGDPAAELHRWYGRFHYYDLDELELLPPVEKGTQ